MAILVIVLVVVVVLAATSFLVVRARGRGAVLEPPPAPPLSVPEAPPRELPSEQVAEREAILAPPVEAPPPQAPAPEAPPVEGPAVEAPPVEGPAVEAAPVEAKPRFRDRLGRARQLVAGYVGSILSRGTIDDATWDDLEEALIRADVGVSTTTSVLDDLRGRVKSDGIVEPQALLEALKDDLKQAVGTTDRDLRFEPGAPNVWLFVGVNGVGKTTTIGKIGLRESRVGRTVTMAAADTFRAAAADQLELWADRVGADLVRGAEGGDPGAVVYDAVQRASARGGDLVLADTAGRLHTKVNLMEELKKVHRVAAREPGRLTEVLLVMDATTGQNGLIQAKQFAEAVDVTGVVLTKLDGTAKGGIVVAIATELGIPIKLVGLGEGAEDLVEFDPDEFVEAIFAT
jgi:fused signal recognition particle receptor